jgi:RNA recognition motif-containing protein
LLKWKKLAAGNAAIEALNGKETDGRTLRVNEAKPKEDRPRDSRPKKKFLRLQRGLKAPFFMPK